MPLNLPNEVIASIQQSYLRGVAAAEKGYIYAQEDEDVVTGALGQALLAEDQVVVADNAVYVWRTTYQKFRGRGKNATEKILGADGIFQLEVLSSETGILFRKGVLFQAKNRWQGKDAKLKEQADLLTLPEGIGIIIDYSDAGFVTCSATAASKANGDRRNLPHDELEGLSETLSNQFLYCHKGLENVFYEPETRTLHLPAIFRPLKRAYRHVFTTKVIEVLGSVRIRRIEQDNASISTNKGLGRKVLK